MRVYCFFVTEEKKRQMIPVLRLDSCDRLMVDGKFFRAEGRRVFLKVVTYGPFPDPQPDHESELKRIREAGFNAVRIYGVPDREVLDVAHAMGLWVMVGLSWEWGSDFIAKPSIVSAAELALADGLDDWGQHPAVAVVMVANEIPVDMVRWMGVVKVRRVIESLIDHARQRCPHLLFAYANFPTTEFLEPDNADFTAMNVYLEKREDFARYLPRLHHVAGDRPVLISEFGLDSRSGSEISQRDALVWQLEECLQAGMAGTTIYAWSDRWLNGNRVMDDWDFGLTDRSGRDKPALTELSRILPPIKTPEDGLVLDRWPMISVVVCTYNGAHRMQTCLQALRDLDYPDYEVIVVDDGSTDDTVEVVGRFEDVRLISLDHGGLSAARNRGAEVATGEFIAYTDDDCEPDAAWLRWLASSFVKERWDACGGPNLPPIARLLTSATGGDHATLENEAVVASAPGAPSHVMLNDLEAEHLPGCNLVVRKAALERLGGFVADYRVAGDDVDFCWRLREAGYRMGFSGGAFVWHRRRTTLWRYFKQQYAYGKAEALLMRDHPGKFRRGGGARWMGRVYAGGAMCADSGSVIYHGAMGLAAYQQLSLTMQPQRPLARAFQGGTAKRKLSLALNIQPLVRGFARWWYSLGWREKVEKAAKSSQFILVDSIADYDDVEATWWSESPIYREQVLSVLQDSGWEVVTDEIDGGGYGNSDWDLVRHGLRLLIAREQHDNISLILTRLEMNARSQGRLPADFERTMASLGLMRV